MDEIHSATYTRTRLSGLSLFSHPSRVTQTEYQSRSGTPKRSSYELDEYVSKFTGYRRFWFTRFFLLTFDSRRISDPDLDGESEIR